MPADDLYWNPMDLESDESMPYPKQYIDPWDLENYAYIRQHLDSVDLNSDPSSLGDTQDSSTFYYAPAKSTTLPSNKRNSQYASYKRSNGKTEDYYQHNNKFASGKYDTLLVSEHGTANYVAIDEITMKNEGIMTGRRKQSFIRDRYEPVSNGEYDRDIYGSDVKDESHQNHPIYEKEKPSRAKTLAKSLIPRFKGSRNRSRSFSVGDQDYESYKPSLYSQQPTYNGVEAVEDLYVRPDYYDSTGTSPIYDDIRAHRSKPKHFKLSNYGHLQIDYSCNWNNLNKYIYN